MAFLYFWCFYLFFGLYSNRSLIAPRLRLLAEARLAPAVNAAAGIFTWSEGDDAHSWCVHADWREGKTLLGFFPLGFFHFPCVKTSVRAKPIRRVGSPLCDGALTFQLKPRACMVTSFPSLIEKATWGFKQIQNAGQSLFNGCYFLNGIRGRKVFSDFLFFLPLFPRKVAHWEGP